MAAPDCLVTLEKLHEAVLALATGQSEATVSFGQRSVTYKQHSLKDLERIYRTYYRMCGAGSGYPDLSTSAQRGAPLHVRIV